MKHGGLIGMTLGAQLVRPAGLHVPLAVRNHYSVECWRKGELAWSEEFWNLVTTAGLNDILTKYFKGSAYTAAWYVGLVSGATPTFAAGDTMASHSGWTEFTSYDESTREALTLGTASSGSIDNSESKASFTISGPGTVGGAFVASDGTKSGTTGTLYSEGDFSTDRTVVDNDVINVTVTLTAASA